MNKEKQYVEHRSKQEKSKKTEKEASNEGRKSATVVGEIREKKTQRAKANNVHFSVDKIWPNFVHQQGGEVGKHAQASARRSRTNREKATTKEK